MPTDEETAPLLDPTSGAQPADQDDQPVYKRRLSNLTSFEKTLAAIAIACLLIASIFIGLFAGTANSLGKEKARHAQTTTITATTTIAGPATSVISTPTATFPGQHPFPIPAPTISPVPSPAPSKKPEDELCLTQECILLAGDILRSIDTSVDPCEDFYSYANGGWQATHSIPSDRGSINSFSDLQDENRKVLLSVLENSGSDLSLAGVDGLDEVEEAETLNLRKLRTGYQACMDESKLNNLGIEPLLPLIRDLTDILGPFVPIGSLSSAIVDEGEGNWSGSFDASYVIPDHLKVGDEPSFSDPPRASVGQVEPALENSVEPLSNDPEHAAATFSKSRIEKLTAALGYTQSRGVSALLDFALEGDAGGDDPQIQELFVYQASGGLPSKEYYEEAPIMDLYTKVVSQVLLALSDKHFGATGILGPFPGKGKGGGGRPGAPERDEEAAAEKIVELAKRVVAFERKLIRAGTKPEYLSDPTYAYNPYEFNNLSQQLSFLDLNAYVSTFNPRNFPNKIIVTYPPYIASVKEILASTPDYVISAYFVTRLSLSFSSALGPATPIKQATRTLSEVLQGLKPGTPEDRQRFCVRVVDDLNGLGLLGGKEFLDRKFAGDSKVKAEKVIFDIIDAFKARLPHLPWMDKGSAKAAAAKADGLYVKIGGPTYPNVTDALALKQWYGPLSISENFFQNTVNTRVISETRSWQNLGKQRNRGSWEMVPQLVNAYYSPPDSEIVFPAGILQPPFFLSTWPDSLNYGAFGSVAAHELSHAFDNTGAQYDERGRLRDWWTTSTVKAFQSKAKCVSDTYSNYSIPGPDGKPVYINGVLTNGEDLGDAGITFAFSAWKEAVRASSSGYKGKLPGLNLTDEQLFFVASSRVWGQLVRPENALASIRTDPHSPNQWRSNGQLRGFPEFAKAFQCKKGSAMNPKDRCNVWNV